MKIRRKVSLLLASSIFLIPVATMAQEIMLTDNWTSDNPLGLTLSERQTKSVSKIQICEYKQDAPKEKEMLLASNIDFDVVPFVHIDKKKDPILFYTGYGFLTGCLLAAVLYMGYAQHPGGSMQPGQSSVIAIVGGTLLGAGFGWYVSEH